MDGSGLWGNPRLFHNLAQWSGGAVGRWWARLLAHPSSAVPTVPCDYPGVGQYADMLLLFGQPVGRALRASRTDAWNGSLGELAPPNSGTAMPWEFERLKKLYGLNSFWMSGENHFFCMVRLVGRGRPPGGPSWAILSHGPPGGRALPEEASDKKSQCFHLLTPLCRHLFLSGRAEARPLFLTPVVD